ncbi:HDIG domain-containing protein, partial [bacterium]|nr:HDIG domain-containing protein [bacterium]
KIITVRNLLTSVEREQDLIQALTAKDTRKEFIDKAVEIFPENRKLLTEVVELVDNFIEPTLHYNEDQTLRRRQTALNDTKPVMKNVRKNKLIVGKGQIITPEQIAQLSTIFKKRVQVDILSTNLGMGLLVIIFVILLGVYIYRYSPKIYEDNRKLILISLILFLSIILGQLVGVSQLSRYLIPMSAGAMLVAILLEARLAVMIAGLLAVFAGVIAGSRLDVSVVSFAGSLAGIYFVIGVRRRSQLIMAGFLVGLASFVCIIGMELLNRVAPSIFIVDPSWGFASGIISAVVVTVILPVLEYIFKITTNISLLELSDLNHPILRKMLTLAPGTYHHSLVVGNLAEAASEAVGANSLLARVASYYHDIG